MGTCHLHRRQCRLLPVLRLSRRVHLRLHRRRSLLSRLLSMMMDQLSFRPLHLPLRRLLMLRPATPPPPHHLRPRPRSHLYPLPLLHRSQQGATSLPCAPVAFTTLPLARAWCASQARPTILRRSGASPCPVGARAGRDGWHS